MASQTASACEAVRPELLGASDEQIEQAVAQGDPMVLRGLIYQLTGDPELKQMALKKVPSGLWEAAAPASEDDVAMVRRKAADFLKAYRDSGAGAIDYGPAERVPESLGLIIGGEVPEDALEMYLEEIGLNPWARSLQWRETPDPKRLADFSVTVVGTGMGGLNAALQLKRAGIPFNVFEKNSGVGGTWWENRYPGARVDTPSRMYAHVFGVDYSFSSAYCDHVENREYFDWVADALDIRGDITFDTEVVALHWNEAEALWDIRVRGPEGERSLQSNAVITSVGFLNRPNIPEIPGMEDFAGESWHTARWPEDADLRGKRVAVVGTGCTGYQLVPELARVEGVEITVFQRTPQWLMSIPGYLSQIPEQVRWLDRNLPFHTNFMRFRASYRTDADLLAMFEVDPEFDDPNASSATNKALRDRSIEFLEQKLDDPKLREIMTPKHPVWSARPVLVDSEYSILDALKLDNVSLVTGGVKRVDRDGVVAEDGSHYPVDVIVFATGVRANEYLYPMEITGRGGLRIEDYWADGGARAYLGCMVHGFPNLWTLYGPNTNGGLPVAANHEMATLYAMQCMERMIVEGKRSVEVTEDAYWRFARLVDERNAGLVWSDPRGNSYYWSKHGRSAVMNPFGGAEMWNFLHRPDWDELDIA